MINPLKKPCSHGRVTRVLESGGFLVTEARYPPGFRIARHEHDLPGFTYVAAGSSVEALRTRSLECVRGSVVVKPPDTPHTNVYGESGAVCLLVEFRPWRYDLIRQHTEAFERVSFDNGGPNGAIAGRLLR